MKFKKFIKEDCDCNKSHILDKSVDESLSDMNRRCEKCNTLLNDMGTCPRCDDGEEERDDIDEGCAEYHVKKYGAYWFGVIGPDNLFVRDDSGKLLLFKKKPDAEAWVADKCKPITEELSVREKLKAAYPELNFDNPVTEECVKEELSNKEKLLKTFPELNFDKEHLSEGSCENTSDNIKTENLSARQKLKAAYPELDFSAPVEESISDTNASSEADHNYDDFDYDDDYEVDDVEMDRAHAALYGGDRMYCDCGQKLVMDEWGGYCPRCNPKDPEDTYSDDNYVVDDDIDRMSYGIEQETHM